MAYELDISTKEKRKEITLEQLVEYCVEMKNREALKWLAEQDKIRQEKKLPNGTTIMAKRNFNLIKNDFFKKFCGYKTQAEINTAEKRRKEQEEKQRQIDEMFAKALESLSE